LQSNEGLDKFYENLAFLTKTIRKFHRGVTNSKLSRDDMKKRDDKIEVIEVLDDDIEIDLEYEFIGKDKCLYKWYYAVDDNNRPLINDNKNAI
jgi:hypothetical protein